MIQHEILVLFVSTAALLTSDSNIAESAGRFNTRDFGVQGDGKTDETVTFAKCFAAVAKAGGGTVTIPAGDYYLPGDQPIELSSSTTVFAYGARFHLPKELGDKAQIVLFSGTDLQDFSWFGGHFQGHCFDHRREANTWEPNANTRMIEIKTTQCGTTERLNFRDIKSHRVAGPVIGVSGVPKAGSQSEVDTFAKHITVENCTLLESGKFMWDYGLLWQILVGYTKSTPMAD